MRKYLLLCVAVTASFSVFSQDFSNKGKDFWVGYGYHTSMSNGNAGYCSAAGGGSQQMVLYFATDQVTNITITIPGFPLTVQTITTGPGYNVTTSVAMPKNPASGNDAKLCSEGLSNKGIHITSDKPMVAYAHVYNGNCSGATILYPTNTLGKEYYSVNYKTISNSQNPNCWFYVEAVDTGTTNVEITPTAPTLPPDNWVPGTTYTVSLTQGQIYNVMGQMTNNTNNPYLGYDLTGSHIKSVSLGLTGCKRIAVFSGAGRISINCPNTTSSSSDNYMVQAMPQTAWGKKYLTTPAAGGQSYNIYRICVLDPATVVKINGLVTALPLQNNFYYEIAATNQPQMIEGDKPIMVAQYFTSEGSCGNNAAPGDPEVIYLSAVEQNINTVQWNATPNFAITNHYFNVVIPNAGTALSSFTLDNAAVAGWVVDPQDPTYSYLRMAVTAGSHIIKSDTGFNAIAYGFGSAESYGYNAGTNIKDLYQQIGVQTQYGIETTPSVCTNSPFKFKVSLPYCADSISWDLSGLPGPPAVPPTIIYTQCAPGPGGPDSTSLVNGKTIYWYSLPSTYSFPTVGNFSVTITAYNNANPDNCGNSQEIDFNLQVSDPPLAGFSFTTPGCYADSVHFAETTPQVPKPTYHFWWDFGDPASGANNTSAVRNPAHVYSAPGTYTVRFSDITTPGCLSDTIVHTFTLAPLPNASISGTTTVCINGPMQFITFTGTGGTAEYMFSYNIDNGSGPGPTLTAGPSVGGSIQVPVPTNTAGTFIYTLTGVRNQLPAGTLCTQNISGQQATVTVTPDATITLTSAPGTTNQTVCINNPITNITYAVGASGTGASIISGALPAGVTGNFAGGVFTISGTPTVAGVFNYTVGTTGPCVNPSLSGTITVNPDASITLFSAPGTDAQTVCINNPITTISYLVAGSGTGASITAGALPAGVTGTFVGGQFNISGTPTVSGVFNYTITTAGPCANNSVSGTITVNDNSTISLTSAAGTDAQTLCVNSPITNITYALGGGATGASISAGSLPAGVTGVFAGGVFTISGTPTVSGVFNYTVSAIGPCNNPSLSGMITVNANASINLTSGAGSDAQTVCINNPIGNITYLIGGGGTGASITAGALPAGVTGSFFGGVFTISGTPTVSGVFNYTVTTTSTCINNSMSGTITVNANSTLTLSSAPGTNTQSLCINTPITTITYAVGSGGTGASITFGSLPTGVTGTYAGGVFTISGTPTVPGVYNYTVTTTGPCNNPSLSGTITVTDNSILTLTSGAGSSNQTACINNPIINITYSVTGGGTGASITAGALPAGVTGTYFGGVFTISGSPTVNGVFNYTVTTTGPCINNSLSGTITVNGNSTLVLTSAPGTSAQTVCINTAITTITYAAGGGATGASITAGVLPTGVTGTFGGGVFTISGTPTVSGVYNYTITTVGPCANATQSGTITVNDNSTITLTSGPGSNTQTVCINNPIINISYSVTGGGTSASITAGALPAGVTGTYAGGVFTIFGTPTVSGVFNYTVTTTGPCINNSLSGTITVNNNSTLTLTSAAGSNTQTLCINNPITNITYSITGGGTGASITAGGLPPGVTGTFAGGVFTITGTPTVAGVYNYTVTTAGPCFNPSLSGTITVNDNSTITLTSGAGSNTQTVCINTPINNISYSITGGGTGASITAGALPAGVTGTFAGGVFTIFGTPTVSGVFNYTVTTTGPCINNALSGTITVNANSTLTLTSAPGSNTQTVCINNAITTITYAIAGTGTGATITAGALPAGVTGTFAGGVFTISGTPTAPGVFNYTVTSNGPCNNPSLSGTITVNDNSSISLSSGAGSDAQTVCINNPIANITYNIAGGGTGASITAGALPAGVTGSYAGGVFTISGTPTVNGVFNYTVTTTGPCINNSKSGTITINANATLTLTSGAGTSNQTVCINNAISNITYSIGGTGTGAAITGGALPTGVTGNFAGGVFTISGTPTVAGVFNFVISSTGPCGNGTANGSITVNDNSSISLSSAAGTNTQTVCNNTAIIDITYAIGGGGTGASITAGALPAGVTGSYVGGVFTITGTPTANGVFNYTVTTTGPCINNSSSGSITVNPIPTASISGDIEVCQNSAPAPNVTFTGAGGTRPYTFTYTINGGAPQTVTTTGASNSATVQQPTTVANTFVYDLVSVSDGTVTACNQLQSGTVTVKVNPVPTATISGDKLVCINSAPPPITFTGTGGTLPYTFTYSLNGGPPQLIVTSGGNSSVTLLAPTSAAGLFDYHLVSVQDGSPSACSQPQPADAVIAVSNIFPQPNFSFSPSVCLPDAVVQFQNLSTISDGTALTYLWTFGDSYTSTALNPSHQYLTVGPFNVDLQATSIAGCVKDIIIPMNNIHPQPVADFTTDRPSVCFLTPVVFTDITDPTSGATTITRNWDLGDGSVDNRQSFSYIYSTFDTFYVKLYITNSFGCNSDTVTKPFPVYNYPTVDAGPDAFILEGGTITMNPVVSGQNLQFLWTPNLYMDDNTKEYPMVHDPKADITYTLTVTGIGGCSKSDAVFVKVLKFPKIPNTFTPNGDGVNDKWIIAYLNTYPDNRVQVFNRTGQTVYESHGYKPGTEWDGTYKGKPLPVDTYYYIIEPGNGRDPITGYVTIIR